MRKLHAAMLVVALGFGAGPVLADGTNPNDPANQGRQEGASSKENEKGFARGTRCAERDAKAGTIKEGVLKLSMDEVRCVQKSLGQKGYIVPEADGTYNDQTKTALKAFQKASGLKESGDFDLPTLNALGFDAAIFVSSKVKGSDYAREEMKRVTEGTTEHPAVGSSDRTVGGVTMGTTELPAGMPIDVNTAGTAQNESLGYIVLGESEIKSIQKRLKEEKYFSGSTDGAITNELIVALRTFQTAKGIHSNGLIDFGTLAAIPEVKIKVEQTKKLDSEKVQETPKDQYKH